MRASAELVHGTGRLVNRAVDQVLLGDARVGSAAEGERLLEDSEQNEALTDDIQRVIVLSLPVIRSLDSGARPWRRAGLRSGGRAQAEGSAERISGYNSRTPLTQVRRAASRTSWGRRRRCGSSRVSVADA